MKHAKRETSPQVDLRQAARFLTLLDESAESFTFQTFDDSGKGRGDLVRVRHGTLEKHSAELADLNARGAGVFVTINETDGAARETKNIVRVRSAYADFDAKHGHKLPTAFDLDPHIIIESSLGSFHAYWLVDGLPLDEFTPTQHKIIAKYGSDKSVHDLPRVMRLPGFIHRKAEPFQTCIYHESGAQPYNADAIRKAFPPVAIMPNPGMAADTATVCVGPVVRHLRSALNYIPIDIPGDNDRDLWIRMGCALRELGDVGRGLWLDWSATSDKHRPKEDAKTWRGLGHDRTGIGAVFAEAKRRGWVNPLETPTAPIPTVIAPAQTASNDGDKLPPHPMELLALPFGLGDIQRWIEGRMQYPDMAAAGIASLAMLSHFAMPHITVNSLDGLGLNEFYMVLAPTGFGKESLRKPFDVMTTALGARGTMIRPAAGELQYSAPASPQGLHILLEKNRAQTFLADEFAEWLAQAKNDGNKKATLGQYMQAYTKATTSIAVPHAVGREYKPVANPRVCIFATSTAERMMEAVSASDADSGALNRFIIFAAGSEPIQKKYDGFVFEPPAGVVDLIAWIVRRSPDTKVTFSPDGERYYREHDSAVIEPMKQRDYRLAGRLSEQAIKISALIALSDMRTVIDSQDLSIAYSIREGLYRRAAALVADDGAISGQTDSAVAVEQLVRAFAKHREGIHRGRLHSHSRKYRGLDVRDREGVIRTLIADGVCAPREGQPALLVPV